MEKRINFGKAEGSMGRYLSEIDFRFIKPATPWPPLGVANFKPWLRFITLLEFGNTLIPCRDLEVKRELKRICNIPRMSAFAIGAIINEGVSRMKEDHVFLNVGVWHGFTLLSAMIGNEKKKCIGVDDFSEFGGPRKEFLQRFAKYRKEPFHLFYEMHYHDYFQNYHRKPIGFYVYDGDHSYENQLKGLELAEPFFTKGTLILVDDTNYREVRKVISDFISRSPYNYDIILDQPTFSNHHPTFWNGVTIIQMTAG